MANFWQRLKDGLNKINSIVVEVLTTLKNNLTLVTVVVVGLLLYYIRLKHKEVAAMKAKLDLVQTQKQADLLESEVQTKLGDANALQKEIDEYSNLLQNLDQKRTNLPEGNLTDSPEDYWKKNG